MIIMEIKCEINVMCLNHPETIPPSHPGLGKNHLPRNRSLVPHSRGRAAFAVFEIKSQVLAHIEVHGEVSGALGPGLGSWEPRADSTNRKESPAVQA